MTGSAGSATVPELWRAAVAAHGHRLVLTDHLGSLTYRELDQLASRSAAALAAVAPPRSRVLVLLPNGRELCAVLLGVWSAGLTAVPVGAGITPYQLQWLLADAAPTVVVTTDEREVPEGYPVLTPKDLLSGPGSAAHRGPEPDDVAIIWVCCTIR